MTEHVDISGLPKGAVLAALYNASAPQGMGFLQARSGDMTEAEADGYLADSPSWDYLMGRPLKVDLEGDTFDPWGFDRDNGGPGTAAVVIARLREGAPVTGTFAEQHETLAAEKGAAALDWTRTPTTRAGATFAIGGDDVAQPVTEAVKRFTSGQA